MHSWYGNPKKPKPQPAESDRLRRRIPARKPHQLFHLLTFNLFHLLPGTMTSIAEGLFKSLPKPKYTGEEEELPQHAQPRGPRVVGADQIDETQVVLRVRYFYIEPPIQF